jgi:hypothetical protein
MPEAGETNRRLTFLPLGSTGTLQPQLRHARFQRGWFQPEPIGGARGAANPPARVLENAADVFFLDVEQLGAAFGGRGRREREGDHQAAAGGDDHRALDDIPELPDVARPGVLLQRREVVPVDRIDPLAKFALEILDDPPDQQPDVLAALA